PAAPSPDRSAAPSLDGSTTPARAPSHPAPGPADDRPAPGPTDGRTPSEPPPTAGAAVGPSDPDARPANSPAIAPGGKTAGHPDAASGPGAVTSDPHAAGHSDS